MLLRYGSLLFALPGLVLVVLYGLELSAVTECTQQGGFYNFDNGECSDAETPLSTYYARHTVFVNLMLLASTVGALAMTWGMLLKGISRSQQD